MGTHEDHMKRLRQQMREQDKRKFQDPDNPEPYEYIVFVWKKTPKKWRKVASIERFTRLTPAFLRRLRKKYRRVIKDDEVMRVVEKRVAEFFGGAGNPPKFFKPLTPKQRAAAKKEARRTACQQKKLAQRTRKRIPYSTKWGRCDRCTHRALWLVGYTHKKSHKRVVKKCCTKHAWRDTSWMPALHKDQVVCIQRRRIAA